MENVRTLNRNLEVMAWGALFVWWGSPSCSPSCPRHRRHRCWLDLARPERGPLVERRPGQRLHDHARHPGARVGRVGAGGVAAGSAVPDPMFAVLLIVLGAIMLVRELLNTTRKQGDRQC